MSYNEMARLDALNVVHRINSEAEYLDFRNLLALSLDTSIVTGEGNNFIGKTLRF